jgi:ABC-type multidrug transport system ATPase subunit
MIEIDNVSKLYPVFHKRALLGWIPSRTYVYGRRPIHGNRALDQVSLRIEQGMFGLLGPNGAGKSTLMKILTGIIPQTYGVVRLGGVDLRRHRLEIRRWISYLPQNFGVYNILTLEQYLEFFAAHCGLDDRDERRRRIGEAIEWVGLGDARDKPMKRFSGGMRQRAGIAQFLLRPCSIIVVDEPTAGLDPVERVRFRLLLAELARTRIVILSTHIVDDITSSCRRLAVLNHGKVIYEGDLDRIRESANGTIWNLTLPENEPSGLPERAILYKKHLGDRILYHYYSPEARAGAETVEPSFEDAYVALLLRHDTRPAGDPPAPADSSLRHTSPRLMYT